MKSFAYVKRCFKAFGIIPWHGTTSKIVDKLQMIFFVILYTQYLCTSLCYLVFQEKDFIAMCLSMFFSASGIMNVWIYSVFLLNRQEIIEIERDMDSMVNERECFFVNFCIFLQNSTFRLIYLIKGTHKSSLREIYIALDEAFFKLTSRFGDFLIVMGLVAYILPNVVQYIIHHADQEYLETQFLLPFPVM